MGLEKYGPEAIGEEKYQEVQEAIEQEIGNAESVYGPEALEGGHTTEEVRAAAERAGLDPDEFEGVDFEDLAEDISEEDGEGSEESDKNLVSMGGDEYEFPPAYDANHIGGGKYEILGPEGDRVENEDHEKDLWDADEGFDAAWVDFEERANEQAQSGEPVEEAAQVSVERLDEILEAEPSLLSERQRAEMTREGGPREEALKVLLKHAVDQDRSEIIEVVATEIEDEEFVQETLAE